MKKLDQEIFVCLDCETTGLDPATDQIIEIALTTFTFDAIIDQFESLIDPKREIPLESIQIHHITPEMVQGKPTIGQVLPRVLDLIGSHIIVGHGIKFDVEIVARAAEQNQLITQIRKNPQIDTLRMARLYGESPVNSLEQLRRHFNIEPEGAHRAMSDVTVNRGVFRHLCRNYRHLGEIFEALSKPILMKIMPLGKHKGRPLKEVPLDYLLWAVRKDFDEDLIYSLRSEINRRKKGNLFSQESNPFKDLAF